MNTQAWRDEVAGFFDSFVEAFCSFSGASIATLYFVPGVALHGSVLRQWRQSYNLVRVESGWQILASTYHVD